MTFWLHLSNDNNIQTTFWGLEYDLSLEVSTVETNHDQDQDLSIYRDVLFQSVKIESLNRDNDKNLDQWRLRQDLLRCHFSNCPEFLDSQNFIIVSVKIETLDWDPI